MTNKILVVEDEEAIRGFIKVNLKRNNFDVIEAGSGEEALEKLDDSVDIVLLDVMLPGINGFEVCAKAREAFPQLGVIILTAKGQEENKIEGLEAGADDYIVKPFSPREMVARVKAVLARTLPKEQSDSENFVFGDLVIDTASHSVKIAGEEISLTPKEFDLLVFLAHNKGIALSREKILQKVWNYDYYGEDRTVDTHIKMLRSHLGSHREDIATVWGVGYKFDPAN